MRCLRCLAGCLLAAVVMAAEGTPFKPDVRYVTFQLDGLHVHVPQAQAEALRPVVARAAAIYRRLAADAGWTPSRTLHLILTDDQDGHNGFSTVVPFPQVNVQLGPTRPESSLFCGDDETARTLIHELGHDLANDRNHGWRGVLESIFGRVMPSEPLSLGVFLLSTPSHVLTPAFWHEGIAQWAETQYADPASAWGGRGRDSLTHMAWRLDAAGAGIPGVGDWRLSYERWPYGNRAYLYGLAYTRWLAAAFGDRRGLWQLVDEQGRLMAPFSFQGGPVPAVGYDHPTLIAQARAALQAEQDLALQRIRAAGASAIQRLTPPGWRLAAPAWIDDWSLGFAADPPTALPSVHTLVIAGEAGAVPATTSAGAWSLGNLRRVGEGVVVQAEAPGANDPWHRSRVVVLDHGRQISLPGERLLMPDARPAAAGWDAVAVEWLPAGASRLLLARAASAAAADWQAVPSQGKPWSPAFRPGRDELCWVETDRAGSRLVVADFAGGNRRVLWTVRGRILHPVWDAAGERIFCASDLTGVANGYMIPLAGEGRPVTNSIGGVLAVVPSPDGSRLAILDHDPDGPFLGVIASDPATWPARVPAIDLAWPAPVGRVALGPEARGEDRPDPADPLPAAGEAVPDPVPYNGWAALRPRFWTPTTLAVPEGALGVVGLATDPLQTHQIIIAAGVGFNEHTPVGLAAWTYSGWNPGFGLIAKRSELGFDKQILAADGNLYDYVETVDTIEGRVGFGLTGMQRRWQGWLAAGVDRHRTVEAASEDYAGLATARPDPFLGDERYLELTVAYDDSLLFPTSFAREDGLVVALAARATDGRGNSLLGRGSYSLPVWREGGHQLVIGGALGWSDGPESLQQRFGVGGNTAQGLPRGYPDTVARGRCLEAASVAYRLPLLRPFGGSDTSRWVTRQVVLEGFYDLARVGDALERMRQSGNWFRSTGIELRLEIEYWMTRFAPGIGIARQIDGLEETTSYLTIGFNW